MLGDGIGVKLEGINAQLDKAVKSLTTLSTLSSTVSTNLNNTNFGGGGGGQGGGSNNNGGGSNFSNGAGSGGRGMGALATGGVGLLKGIGAVGGAVFSAVNNGLPDVTQTIGRANQYYGASLMGGTTRNAIATATFNGMAGGMTSAGSDAMVAGRLTAAGIAPNTAQYASTVTGVSNAAKYLGMDNSSAVNAITGLKTGSMSATLMRNFGIQTADFKTGNPLTQGAIFEQLANKIFTPGKKLTTENVMASFQQGWAGADLRASGLSQDQQQLFQQYMVAKTQGVNMNLEDPNAMKAALAKSAAAGNANPGQAGYDINTSDTKLMQTVTDAYIKGQQAAVPLIQQTNDLLGKLDPAILSAKSALDTLAGARATGAAMTAAAAAAGGLTTALMGASDVISALTGGGGGGGGGTGGGVKGKKGLKMAKKAGAGLAGGLLGGGINMLTDVMGGNTDAGTIGGDVGSTAGAMLGGAIGMAIPIPILDVAVAGILGTLGAQLGGQLGTSVGNSIAGNTKPAGGSAAATPGMGATSAKAPANTSLTFILPAPGKIGSRFNDMEGRAVPHNGLDIECPAGTAVSASGDGVVVYMRYDNIGGNTLIIKHTDKLYTWYCHLSAYGSSIGKAVKQGERIGTSGATGTVTGAHLHFGASPDMSGKSWINPESILNGAISAAATTGAAATPGNGATSAPASSSATPGNIGTTVGAISDSMISDLRAKTAAPSLAGMSPTGAGTNGASVGRSNGTASTMMGTGSPGATTGQPAIGQAGSLGIYLAGAPRAKNGQSYVANDGPINVHAGEAILTAQEADAWRADMRGQGAKPKGTNVTINVTVASASEAEARKFAKIVKGYLEEDTMFGKMGRN